MSEMIERVARAIRNISPEAWSQIPAGVQRMHCEDAQRVIEAMREPTGSEAVGDGMIYSGGCCTGYSELDQRADIAKDVWHAMIDAALSEETQP